MEAIPQQQPTAPHVINMVSKNDIMIQGHSTEYDFIDNDEHLLALTPDNNPPELYPTLSLQDINHVIHYTNSTLSKSFTQHDLNKHLDEHWTIEMEVNTAHQTNTPYGQMDGGANTNVTNNKRLLKHYQNIQRIPVTGIGDGTACYIIGYGYMDLLTLQGDWMSVKVFYAPSCSGTIISPNAIVHEHPYYTSWTQHSHLDEGTATIHFYNKNSYHMRKTIKMKKKNNLWYVTQPLVPTIQRATAEPTSFIHNNLIMHDSIVQSLSTKESYELWHQRLLHPSAKVMTHLSACIDGVPPKFEQPPFHHCDICAEAKGTKTKNAMTQDYSKMYIGQQFHMDFGFVSGKDQNNQIIRSHDGYNSYLLIIDAKTRYIWTFLSKTKHPPIKTIKLFLQMHGAQTGIVRTDQGGELARSKEFQEVVAEANYSIETTGAGNSSQNGLAERPHRTLGNMIRAALVNSNLPSKFWSDALIHSTFIKNRLPHAAFGYKSTPYTQLTGNKPNLKHLKIFGTPITTRKPGLRSVKLDTHTYRGIFLRYAKTMQNIVFYDTQTKEVKTTTYAQFDEAQYSQPQRSKGANILLNINEQQSKSINNTQENTVAMKLAPNHKLHTNEDTLFVIPHTKDAYIPTQGSDQAAGYDLHALQSHKINPNDVAIVDTGIGIIPPAGTYGRIASRSGLASKHNVETKAGVIDPDYTGTLKIILHNFGNTTFHIDKGDRVAQLVLERYAKPNIRVMQQTEVPQTQRGNNGLGSTGVTVRKTGQNTDTTQAYPDVDLTLQAPEFTMDFRIRTNSKHPTLGLITEDTAKGLMILRCEKSTPSAKIPQWRRTIKGGYIRAINGDPINSRDDLIQKIKTIGPQHSHIVCTIAAIQPVPIHPDTGVPQLHFDQIRVIDQHMHSVRYDEQQPIDEAPPFDNSVQLNKTMGPPLTRRRLMQQPDWEDWFKSEHLQLDQYETQNMFSEPTSLPTDMTDVNVLPMIWTYLTKTCGRKKARCVANGAPHLKGSVTLANTYAACLEQSGARMFWAISALKNRRVYGADASNAFAEAPPPKAPLYLKVDQAYRDWYKHRKGIDLPPDTYVRVQHAIQGHPESPRLWQDHIDKILQSLGYNQLTHEPCIYVNRRKDLHEEIYLLRQVDDFAIACTNQCTADRLWDEIDSKLNADLKREGLLERHNGVDIEQTSHYIRINCKTYLSKILQHKSTLLPTHTRRRKPIPMKSDNEYIRELETASGPTDHESQEKLEQKMGFKYRAATGELIFAMVTCRPDISHSIIKLTQYNNNPAEIHYKAVLEIYAYLRDTKTKGLTYWKTNPDKSLPTTPPIHPDAEEYVLNLPNEHNNTQYAYGYVDSDWAGDSLTRKSISGIAFLLAGAAIVYKTLHQKSVALSSTEAEFYALAEAGKIALYIRSILNEIGIDQQHATPIFEDNQGCLFMAEARKPTKKTRHIEIRHYAILDWIEQDLITLKKIHTSDNAADTLNKTLSGTMFHRHNDTLMGYRQPKRLPPTTRTDTS